MKTKLEMGFPMKFALFVCLTGSSFLATAEQIEPTDQERIGKRPGDFEDELQLPAPTGNYKVGYTSFDLEDPDRFDKMTLFNLFDKRRINLRVWYPASDDTGTIQPKQWLTQREVRAIQNHGGGLEERYNPIITVDNFVLRLGRVKTNSYANAEFLVPPSEQGYPVIIFGSGLAALSMQMTSLLEELASHGFVVITISRPHTDVWVVYSDDNDKVVSYDLIHLGSRIFLSRSKEIGTAWFGASTIEVANRKLESFFEDPTSEPSSDPMFTLMDIWEDDIGFLLNHIEHYAIPNAILSENQEFLDLSRVGVFGYSVAGSAAVAFCHNSGRCKAAANLDGAQYDAGLWKTDVAVPLLFLISEKGGMSEKGDAGSKLMYSYNDLFYGAAECVHRFYICKAEHGSFGDFSFIFKSEKKRGEMGLGNIDGRRMLEIVNDYTVAFANHYVKEAGQETALPSLLSGGSPGFPNEVIPHDPNRPRVNGCSMD